MLSKNQVVNNNCIFMARKAIESTYIGKCTVSEYKEVEKPNKSTGFAVQTVLENQPCKLSFEKITTTANIGGVSRLAQTVKLFIAPEVVVKSGSRLSIVQNGIATDYQSSGVPAVYATHQEIMLDLFKGWS